MTAGRPRKPTEIKRLTGNPGHRPLPPPVASLQALTALDPTWDPDRSGAELVQALLANGASWIGPTDTLLVILVQDGWDERRLLRASLALTGSVYHAVGRDAGEIWRSRPEVAQLRQLERQLTSWLSLLGLSPSDRSRLGLAEVKARTRLEEVRLARLAAAGRRPS